MYLKEKVVMNQCTKIEMFKGNIVAWFHGLSKTKQQWFWFVFLWCSGFMAVFIMAQIIRVAMGIEH